MKNRWAKLVASLILSFAAEAFPEPSDDVDIAEKCRALGFSSKLVCSTCKSFEDIVADEGKIVSREAFASSAQVGFNAVVCFWRKIQTISFIVRIC